MSKITPSSSLMASAIPRTLSTIFSKQNCNRISYLGKSQVISKATQAIVAQRIHPLESKQTNPVKPKEPSPCFLQLHLSHFSLKVSYMLNLIPDCREATNFFLWSLYYALLKLGLDHLHFALPCMLLDAFLHNFHVFWCQFFFFKSMQILH